MNFKVGDIISGSASCNFGDSNLIKGLIKGRISYIFKSGIFFVVEILEHEENYFEGSEISLPTNNGKNFKLYEEPEVPESIVFKTKNFNAVVYRDGRRTIAKDKDTGKYAVATCSPEDTYDFMTGAIIAMARLTCTDPVTLVNLERTVSQK